MDEVLKVDLHVHTSRSDGLHSPEEMVKAAKEKGLCGIAITDHDVEPPKIVDKQIIVIPGVEVTSSAGHILLLGVAEIPKKNSDPWEVVDFARERDYVIVIPHPYDKMRAGIGDLARKLDCDAIEVINGGITLKKHNEKAFKLALEIGKPMVGGSDAHSKWLVGWAYTEFFDPIESVDDVLDAIKRGRVRAGGGTYGIFRKSIVSLLRRLRL